MEEPIAEETRIACRVCLQHRRAVGLVPSIWWQNLSQVKGLGPNACDWRVVLQSHGSAWAFGGHIAGLRHCSQTHSHKVEGQVDIPC